MKVPADLQRFGLQSPRKPARRRLVCTSEGGPGTGKTDLFYRTFPRPALVIDLDLNGSAIEERHLDDDVLIKRVVVPPLIHKTEDRRKQDEVLFAEVRDLYRAAIEKDYFRSYMIDNGTALYDLCRRAYLTDLDFGAAPQTSYVGINSVMSRFYQLAKQHRCTLYIPHRQTEERVESYTKAGKKTSTPTGELKYSGWKNALYESSLHLLLTKDPKHQGKTEMFDCQIVKCSSNHRVEGLLLTGNDITYRNLGMLAYPQSEESEWV
jgi:hypothetical protein